MKTFFFNILFSNKQTKTGIGINVFIITLIILNVFAVILESVKSIYSLYSNYFIGFEIFSVSVFTIEYIVRFWVTDLNPKYRGWGRFLYLLTPFALIDLFSILPFYLPMIIPIDLRFIRIIRIFRIVRLFKIGRYHDSLHIIIKVLKSKKEELLITIMTGFILLIIASCFMYIAENSAQPDKFSSIPATMWWGVATLTTVGYGDMYPVTAVGKFISSIIAVLGIGLFALPAGILGAGFVEVLGVNRKDKSSV